MEIIIHNKPEDNFKSNFFMQSICVITFILILWIIKLIEIRYPIDFYFLGVYPRKLSGLAGILTMPLVHKDLSHLLSNSIPLLLLGISALNYYEHAAFKTLLITWVGGGLLLWIFGRPSWHIGASGLVYGLSYFIFFSGVIRRDRSSMAMALIVVFLYGSIFWGILPLLKYHSWEGHLTAAICGTVCSFLYRNVNRPPKYDWELEED